MRLSYRVVQPQSRPGTAKLMFDMLDASECGAVAQKPEYSRACDTPLGLDLEYYTSMHDALDDASGEWTELRKGPCRCRGE